MKKNNPFSIPVYSLSGRSLARKIELNPEVFGIKPNEKLVAQAVRVYLARQRSAFPKTKTRGEVQGSRRKIWAQKGTGRARHGDRYAPIFVGGGIAHGPRGNRDWNLRLPKKMKKLAYFSVFSSYFASRKMIVTAGWQKLPPKTRRVEEKLANFLKGREITARKIGIILTGIPTEISRGWRNLKEVNGQRLSFRRGENINIHWLLNQDYLLLDEKTVKNLNGQVN